MNRFLPPLPPTTSFGPPMNPLPVAPAYPPQVAVPTLDEVLAVVEDAQFQPSRHGSRFAHNLWRFSEAIGRNDQAVGPKVGEALLLDASRAGASQDFMQALLQSLQRTLNVADTAAKAKSGAVGCGPEPLGEKDDNIDWYEPDPNRFYVRDKRSGVQLEGLVEDLRVTDRYIARGAEPPTRQLFIGPPGCGKTAGILWLGSQLGMRVALIRIDATIKSDVGGIARKLRTSFEAAMEAAATDGKDVIIAIDEFEALVVPRTNTSANVGQWSRETTSAVLQLLDSLPPKQIVTCATNYLHLIDDAAQSRMGTRVYFYPPNRDARAALVKQWWAKAPHEGRAKKLLLDLTEGQSGRMLKRACDAANRAAARRALEAPISEADVHAAMALTLGEATSTPPVQAGPVPDETSAASEK